MANFDTNPVRPEPGERHSSPCGQGQGTGFDKLSPNGLRVVAILGFVLTAACTPVDYGFGETTRWNIEQQVENPDPEYAGDIREGGSGERGADAVRRYNEGQVKQPAATGAGGGTGGSSASTSASGGPQ